MVKKKVNIRREDRKIQLDKKTGNISNLQVPKITALYYYQFLKLLTELEDMKYVLKVEQRKKGLKVGDKLNAKVKINRTAFKHIDFDWIRRQPSLFNLKVDMNISQADMDVLIKKLTLLKPEVLTVDYDINFNRLLDDTENKEDLESVMHVQVVF